MPSRSRAPQKQPWWRRWYVIAAAVALIAVVVVVVVVPRIQSASNGGSDAPRPTGTASTEAEWETVLKQYETEHNIDVGSAWGGAVLNRAVENNSELRFFTTLDRNESGTKTAEQICTDYADFPQVDARIRLIVVFSQSGIPLATCGPAA